LRRGEYLWLGPGASIPKSLTEWINQKTPLTIKNEKYPTADCEQLKKTDMMTLREFREKFTQSTKDIF